MLPLALFGAYRQYKQDTDAVASWLAATARAHGYPADLLANYSPPEPPKSGRLKGKARKEAAREQAADASGPTHKYTVAIRDFVPLAE